MFLRLKSFLLLAFVILTGVSMVFAQQGEDQKKPVPIEPITAEKGDVTAEQVAETAIFYYSGLRGRDNLNQIRKTTFERGKINVLGEDGKTEQAKYQRWIMRGDSLDKERVRYEQEFPNARFSLVYDGKKVFGIFNNAVFTPREDASQAFRNQIWHGLEAFLRYKENGSKLELVDKEKIMGVDFYLINVTDKENRKTQFYVSQKTFRVLMLKYEEDGVKYRRKFYDYNYAQGTLVPYRTVLWADDKQIEETDVQIVSFSQKLDESRFDGS